MGSRFVIFAGILLASLMGCAEGEDVDSHEHEWDEHVHNPDGYARELGVVQGAVSCSASMKKYPVKGKHNGGWDPKALTYACHPHPSGAKDNSDFIGGDHYGNDIFAKKGTPLVACVDGTIVSVKTTSIGGKNVTIKDACGWYYYYAHLNTFASGLKVGKKVKAGDPLGTVGNTGNASGTSPHLHFSVYPGTYTKGIDPFPLLQSVDKTACTGGTVDPPPPAASKPKIKIWSTTAPADTIKNGPSAGKADVFEGQKFNVDVFIKVETSGSQPKGQIHIGYWVEEPYLKAVTYKIHSDWPAKDQKSWKLNDSDSAPGNPSKTNPPKSGKINLYAMSKGETKRVRFTLQAKKYSLGAVDHPDLRAWIWHVDNFYGEQTGFYDKVEVNKAGKELKTYVQHDVYGKTHWQWNGTKSEVEGWTKGNKIAELTLNTSVHCLAIKQGGSDPYVHSPKISWKASKWKGVELRIRHHEPPTKKGQLFFLTSTDNKWDEAKSVHFEAHGDSKFHKVGINMSKNPKWKGTITRLRLDPTTSSTGWYDIDWFAAREKIADTIICQPGPEVCDGKDNNCDGKVPANELDGDGDGQLPCKGDCDDNNAKVYAGAPELCDAIDNDCDGAVDEALDLGAACSIGQGECQGVGEVACGADKKPVCTAVEGAPTKELCDGFDNDCDGQIDEDFGLGGVCDGSMGACSRAGVWVCSEDGSEAYCDAPPAEPSKELCDGIDNNCDGQVDEGFSVLEDCITGEGDCQSEGFFACDDEGDVFCKAPKVEGIGELCDGKDNDCDAEIDEGFPVGESCASVEPGCTKYGTWVCGATGIETECDVTGAECETIPKPPTPPKPDPRVDTEPGDGGDPLSVDSDVDGATDAPPAQGSGAKSVTGGEAGGCTVGAAPQSTGPLLLLFMMLLAIGGVRARRQL